MLNCVVVFLCHSSEAQRWAAEINLIGFNVSPAWSHVASIDRDIVQQAGLQGHWDRCCNAACCCVSNVIGVAKDRVTDYRARLMEKAHSYLLYMGKNSKSVTNAKNVKSS